MRSAHGIAVWVAMLASIFAWPATAVPAAPARPADGPAPGITVVDIDTWIDANNINMCISNLGLLACQVGGPGFEYPRGSGHHAMYAAGVWIAAEVNGEIRAAIGAYTPEYRPGCIYPDGTYDPDSVSQHRVFKLVKGDTLSPDYAEWPAVLGAPVDTEGRPLVTGEQTLWCVYHDANPAYHWAPEGGTAPLGIEVQQTAYAFGWPVASGNVVYVEFRVINKLANILNNAYFGLLCDPDIGGYTDDLVGCDPALDLGFGYNGEYSDDVYGIHPPAVGVEFLSGPTGPGGVPQGLTAFRGYSNGEDPTSPAECYNFLKGLSRDGSVNIDPTTSLPTTFEFSGDPVAGTGWLDSSPCDRRFILTSGPFDMAPGDTQQVAIAFVAAKGRGPINSVRAMKQYALAARQAYEADFAGQFLPATEVAPGLDGVKAPGGGDVAELTEGPGLGVGPNPAVGQATIRINSLILGQYELLVIDTAGRAVRTLSGSHQLAGQGTVTWDGRNDSGEPVPPGVYSVRLIGAGRAASAKIVLLR